MKSHKNNKSSNLRKPNYVTKQQVRQMLASEIETKSGLVGYGVTAATTTGTFYRMTGVSNGVTSTTRIGDELTLKKFQFRYTVQVGAVGLIAAADQYNTVRVIFFKWLGDDAVNPPLVASLLATGASANLTLAPYNYDQRALYSILYDKTHVVFNTPVWNGSAVLWAHGPSSNFTSPDLMSLPAGRLGKIDFHNNLVSGTGHVYALIVSDSAFAPNPTTELVAEFLFTDA